MKYTYNISQQANSEAYKKLRADIEALYSDYSLENEIKETDGTVFAVYKNNHSEDRICAELSYEKKEIYVSSDRKLLELEKLYDSKSSHENRGFSGFSGLLNSLDERPLIIKAFVIPAALLVLSVVELLFFRGDKYIFSEMLQIGCSLYIGAILYGGGLLFIPAVILSKGLAEKKNRLIYKLPLSVFIIFSELHILIFYCYDIEPINIAFLLTALLSALVSMTTLFFVYMLFLPLIIADEIAGNKHSSIYGERAKSFQSFSWWICTAVAAIAVLCVFVPVMGIINDSKEEKEIIQQKEDICLSAAPLFDEFGDELRTVADYSREHEYYDWYYCPDESVKAEWAALFVNDSDFGIGEKLRHSESRNGGEEIRFKVYFESSGEYVNVSFDSENIYVNGEIYESAEVRNNI